MAGEHERLPNSHALPFDVVVSVVQMIYPSGIGDIHRVCAGSNVFPGAVKREPFWDTIAHYIGPYTEFVFMF